MPSRSAPSRASPDASRRSRRGRRRGRRGSAAGRYWRPRASRPGQRQSIEFPWHSRRSSVRQVAQPLLCIPGRSSRTTAMPPAESPERTTTAFARSRLRRCRVQPPPPNATLRSGCFLATRRLTSRVEITPAAYHILGLRQLARRTAHPTARTRHHQNVRSANCRPSVSDI